MSEWNLNSDFLGKGWGFPPRFGLRNREVEMVSAQQDIRQSLAILLSTVPGERVMAPGYGCGIKNMVFEAVNETVLAQLSDMVERAVLFYEPRITLHDIQIDFSEQNRGLLRLQLDYTIITINARANLVYPFYFREATNADL